MDIGLFCFQYSNISGNQTVYQSPRQNLTMYFKFESTYYVTNHHGLLGAYVL